MNASHNPFRFVSILYSSPCLCAPGGRVVSDMALMDLIPTRIKGTAAEALQSFETRSDQAGAPKHLQNDDRGSSEYDHGA